MCVGIFAINGTLPQFRVLVCLKHCLNCNYSSYLNNWKQTFSLILHILGFFFFGGGGLPTTTTTTTCFSFFSHITSNLAPYSTCVSLAETLKSYIGALCSASAVCSTASNHSWTFSVLFCVLICFIVVFFLKLRKNNYVQYQGSFYYRWKGENGCIFRSFIASAKEGRKRHTETAS